MRRALALPALVLLTTTAGGLTLPLDAAPTAAETPAPAGGTSDTPTSDSPASRTAHGAPPAHGSADTPSSAPRPAPSAEHAPAATRAPAGPRASSSDVPAVRVPSAPRAPVRRHLPPAVGGPSDGRQ
ncbi:hypothetical protein DZF91_27175, partial [Actinomadura logoneensis]